MNTLKKRTVKAVSVKTLKVKAAKKVSADAATRAARMETYMRKTHGTFLSNLTLADELQIPSHGAFAGAVAKRA